MIVKCIILFIILYNVQRFYFTNNEDGQSPVNVHRVISEKSMDTVMILNNGKKPLLYTPIRLPLFRGGV